MGILLIAKDNIKKQKGNAFILILLVALAVLMLYVGISVLSNMEQVIDQRNEAVSGADYFLFSASSQSDEILDYFEKDEDVTYVEREKALFLTGSKYFTNNVLQKDAEQINFYFLNKDAERSLSVIDIIDEGTAWKVNSIILPYYMKVGMGHQTGDIFNIIIDEQKHSFEIYGFTEDIMFSTPTNVPVQKCFVSNPYFKTLSEEAVSTGYMYRVELKENVDTEKFFEKSQDLKENISDFLYTAHLDLFYDQMKDGASITINIFMAVLTLFAVLLIVIALVIVHFNINNTIEMNIKNIGILQATGYTSRQLAASTVLEFLLIGAFGMTAGLLCAKGASDVIGGILSSSIGLRWEMNFDILSAIVSVGITTLLILLAVLFCVRRYWQIVPLYALRSGIHTHNFRKNHMRLDRTKLPLSTAIGIKKILDNSRKNISVSLIVMLLTFIGIISVSIYQNLVLDTNNMIQIMGLEVADIAVQIEAGEVNDLNKKKDTIKNEIALLDGVEEIIEFTDENVTASKGAKEVSLNCNIYDKPNNLRINNVVEGRCPEYNNEIMISTVIAKKLEVSTGEVMYLEMNNSRIDFLVVGISQGVNHLGRNAMLTIDGALRLNDKLIPNTFYLYVKDAASIDNMIHILKEKLTGSEVTIVNSKKDVDILLISVIYILKILCIVMSAVVAFVIALILVLLVKTQLIRETRQLAIYKALGYTTGQLIWQITMSYIPVFFIGILLGCVTALIGIDPAVSLCLASAGAHNINMDTSFAAMLGIVTVILLWSEVIIVLCSAKIRKITPYEMQQE